MQCFSVYLSHLLARCPGDSGVFQKHSHMTRCTQHPWASHVIVLSFEATFISQIYTILIWNFDDMPQVVAIMQIQHGDFKKLHPGPADYCVKVLPAQLTTHPMYRCNLLQSPFQIYIFLLWRCPLSTLYFSSQVLFFVQKWWQRGRLSWWKAESLQKEGKNSFCIWQKHSRLGKGRHCHDTIN